MSMMEAKRTTVLEPLRYLEPMKSSHSVDTIEEAKSRPCRACLRPSQSSRKQ